MPSSTIIITMKSYSSIANGSTSSKVNGVCVFSQNLYRNNLFFTPVFKLDSYPGLATLFSIKPNGGKTTKWKTI